jgi:plastocyanin
MFISKKMLIIGAVALAAILIIIVSVTVNTQKPEKAAETQKNQTADQAADDQADEIAPETAAEAKKDLIEPVNPVLENAEAVVPGANPITEDNIVVTQAGEPVKNDAPAISPEAPKQTLPVEKEKLSDKVIKLDISSTGFDPNEFTVKSGEPVTLSVTSADSSMHVFVFEDPSLQGINITTSTGGETRAITFNAPSKPGEYKFYCWMRGHADKGEVGKMIVE